jgi:outer membrane protein OmpA-like peptidoglycan-associated protein
MKAYPNVNVKIGGYTDNVGDDSHNMKLSQERANRTMSEIERLGISSSRMTAEGYGEQHPIADNSTEEGRQRNRRIDIRVTKK